MIMRISSIFLILILCAGCRLGFDKDAESGELSATIPETILINISQVSVEGGKVISKMDAERLETFKNKNTLEITKLHYKELNKTGETTTEGVANQATYYTDTENARISGNIHFYSEKEKTGVRAEFLNWDHSKKILTSNEEEKVTVSKDDGSYIKGTGFRTDLRLREITFSGKVEGVYIEEE